MPTHTHTNKRPRYLRDTISCSSSHNMYIDINHRALRRRREKKELRGLCITGEHFEKKALPPQAQSRDELNTFCTSGLPRRIKTSCGQNERHFVKQARKPLRGRGEKLIARIVVHKHTFFEILPPPQAESRDELKKNSICLQTQCKSYTFSIEIYPRRIKPPASRVCTSPGFPPFMYGSGHGACSRHPNRGHGKRTQA